MSEQFDYRASIRADRLLNTAILNANICEGYEELLAIFDRYYADEIRASIDGCVPVSGKAAVRNRVAAFLMPIHALVEVGGATASIQIEPIASDSRDETYSSWKLELRGTTGRGTTLKWRTQRRWREGQVIAEHHGDIEQTGEPLTEGDLKPSSHFHNIS